MASAARSLLSLFTLICLMGAAVATSLGIYEASTDADPSTTTVDLKFIIPAAVGNSLLVMVLVYLTATIKTIGPGEKFFISFILIAGLVIEIYLTTYIEKMPESIATYFMIALNFLIRSFYVLQFVQDEWTRPFAPAIKAASTVLPSVATPKSSSSPPTPKDTKSFVEKWDKVWQRIRDSDKGLDMKSRNDAYFSVIKPAEKEGKTTTEVIMEAAKLLKYKDGSTVDASDIKIGGRS
jgi:hypothetical protein